jgi:5'-nucleotidase / UDP-sugar diphosphatase
MIKILAVLLSVIFALTGCTGGSTSDEAANQASGGSESQGSSWRTEVPRISPTQEPETEAMETAEETTVEADDILILYTGDVRCGVNDGIGYAGVAALKNELQKNNDYVALVDCGDATQGAEIGDASEGLYIIDIMNHLGYDLATLGDHEFDYGMAALQKNMDQANYPYTVCNLEYTGEGESPLSGLRSYVIKEYGGVKVAFVGATAPSVLKGDSAEHFSEDGNCVYDLCAGDGTELCERIQEAADEARDEGASYVILVSHLGTEDEACGVYAVAANTDGIDAILDGGAGNAAGEQILENKAGGKVILSQTGSGLADVGLLTITAKGNISSSLISGYPDSDKNTQSVVDGLLTDGDDAEAEKDSREK